MQRLAERFPLLPTALRVALVVFVVAWIFGPYELRSTVPVWVAFLVVLGLEINFFLGAVGRPAAPRPDRGPQLVDRERYGYLGGLDGEEDDELEEDEGLWAPVSRFLVGLGVIAALALVFWFVEGRTGWDSLSVETRAEAQDRFSTEASRIAGKPVRIRCDESGAFVGAVQHADGVATVGGELAYLTPERCHDLYRLAFDGEVTSSQTARALAVLAHEAWHLRGIDDEGTTECYALQSAVELGERLGLSEDTAHRMMQQQLVENAGRTGAGTEYVVPPDCQDGAVLDLNPGSERFP